MNQAILDRKSALPLYYQIQQHLLEEIRTGERKAGDLLPSEKEISDRLGISRMTARQALKSLCQLGVAYSLRGKGTFISRSKLEINFRQILSFSEEMRARGYQPHSTVLSFERVRPAADIAEPLHLQPNEDVIRLRRVRLADSVPLCIETTHLPHRLCPDLLERHDPSKSLYEALASLYGIRVELADEVAEASLASAAEARLLRIRAKSPVFRFTRTAFMQSGQPVEFVKSVYRADRCKVVTRLSRQV